MNATQSSFATDSVTIHVNGQPMPLERRLTVAALLADSGHAGRRVAVELNGEVVPRSRHADTELRAGDRVEIVVAVGGG